MIKEVAQYPAVGAGWSAEIVDLQPELGVSDIIENLSVAVAALAANKWCVATLKQVNEQVGQADQVVLRRGAEELKLARRREHHVAAEVLLVASWLYGAILLSEPLSEAKVDQSQFVLAGLGK